MKFRRPLPRFSGFTIMGLAALMTGSFFASCQPPEKKDEKALSESTYNLPGKPPYLFAHYLPWFEDGHAPDAEKAWDHWKWTSESAKHDPDQRRTDGLRDIAAAHYPLVGPYATTDKRIMRYHFETAKAAGIAGFVVLWYGPNSFTDEQMIPLLDMAESCGMKIALCYEEKINWPPYRSPNTRDEMVASATKDLTYAADRYAQHPAYLLRHGAPVVFQFNYWGTDRIGPRTFTPGEWKQVLAGLPGPISYVRQNFDPAYYPTLDASYHWWTKEKDTLARHQQQVGDAKKNGSLDYHVGVVAPGFNDSGVDGWGNGTRFEPRNGTATLEASLSNALVNDPELVQIVTWNDFNEGTEIEPTVDDGFAALDAIEKWWGEVKQRTPNLEDNREPLRKFIAELSPEERAELPPQALTEARIKP